MVKDPVTAYAERVRDGKEVASYLVRLACARHMKDLQQAKAKGIEWRRQDAQDAIDFFSDVLVLPEDTDADDDEPMADNGAASPFVLSPFQQFIVGSLFGWYTTKGHRRFHQAYVETAKGSGKTPLGAGTMLYMLVADGERGAQVYAAAVTRDQAKLAFTDAERMVEASAHLSELLDSKVNNLAVESTGSFFRPISSEKRGLDGKRVHGCLIDELHEHPTPVVVNKMRKGIKGRRNALILEITNSGFDRTSVCWNHHEYSRKVLEGTVQNEEWFAFVCGLDPCDACRGRGKWFPDETCPNCDDWKTEGPHWLKANPNLGVSLPWDYLRNLVNQAKGMPSEVSDTLRFNFCVWTQGESRFLDAQRWHLCAGSVSASDLIGARCYAGLDLGQTDDFSAFVRVWVLPDGRLWVVPKFWIPEAAVERNRNRPFDEWMRSGALTVTEGETVIYAVMKDEITRLCDESNVLEVGYDPKFAEDIAQHLRGKGYQALKVRQGFDLTESMRTLATMVNTNGLIHDGNPVMGWMAANLVASHGPGGLLKPDKDRSPEKIDGQTALLLALDIIKHQPDVPEFSVDDLVAIF